MRLLAVLAIFVLTIPAFAGELTPDLIRAMVAKDGARAAVQAIDNGDEENNPWFGLLDQIETGNPDWIDLVPLLAPGTDAGTAEGLVITLSRTLKTNAPAILALIADGQFTVADLCADNDIEVPVGDYLRFLYAIDGAVAAVSDPQLHAVRDDCLEQIAAARDAALAGEY